jgi:hypothetical protein
MGTDIDWLARAVPAEQDSPLGERVDSAEWFENSARVVDSGNCRHPGVTAKDSQSNRMRRHPAQSVPP